MRYLMIPIAALVGGLAAASFGAEADVRYYQQHGVTYRETRAVVRRPVSQTRIEQREQTVYRQRYSTEMRSTTQSVVTPVVQYYWQAQWHGWWNPFQQPYLAYHAVPYTSWQTRQQTVRLPVTQRELVPEKRTVRVPVTTLRLVRKEEVSRVAVKPAPSAPALAPSIAGQARDAPIGGIARLERDPPRQGTSVTADGWRARR